MKQFPWKFANLLANFVGLTIWFFSYYYFLREICTHCRSYIILLPAMLQKIPSNYLFIIEMFSKLIWRKNSFPHRQWLTDFSTLLCSRDEFGPNIFGPGLKWAMKIMSQPGHGPKPMLALGPCRAWAKSKFDGPGLAGPNLKIFWKKLLFL